MRPLERLFTRVALVLLASSNTIGAQTDVPTDRARTLSTALLRLHEDASQARLTPPTAQLRVPQLILERSFALEKLMRTNPSEALGLAFPPELVSEPDVNPATTKMRHSCAYPRMFDWRLCQRTTIYGGLGV